MKDLINKYRTMLCQQEESQEQKAAIMSSALYTETQAKIEVLQASLRGMTSGVIDYSEAIKDLEQEIVEEMGKQGITGTEEVEIKFKEKKAVNVLGVKHTIEDEDAFISLVTISQKDLKDYANTVPGMKKAIMSCVEVVDRIPSGVKLTS